jgi:glycine/D-amino acid oxidase-like deaminating enzyme
VSVASAARRGTPDFDSVVIGGGLVGAAIAWGLTRAGERVAILDEGDTAVRASRANFALVWVQSKGLGMPEYSAWTVASSKAWKDFARELGGETKLDVSLQQPGGFSLCLSEAELEARKTVIQRFHNQGTLALTGMEMVDRATILKAMPEIGPDVVGGSYCRLDGHVNSLRLLRALHTSLKARGATYLPSHTVSAIRRVDRAYEMDTSGGPVRGGKVILAAGNANQALGAMVGLNVPMKPERGQILVTERVQPFLNHPVVTLRQTDEGTVMIGDSKEDGTDPAGTNLGINSVMAQRAVRMFPLLGRVNVVRTWRGIRVMPEDGFPIYDQSKTHPGAFVVTCHSGVTLAAIHGVRLAPMIARGRLEAEVAAFGTGRFGIGFSRSTSDREPSGP